MQVAVIGGTGRTGQQVIAEALRRGWQVGALVRDPAKAPADWQGRVAMVVGDARDPHRLAEVVRGADAVISTLGPAGDGSGRGLHAAVAPVLVGAMRQAGVRRLVAVWGAGVDLPGDAKTPVHRLISALAHRLGRGAVQDKESEYAAVRDADLDWTGVRPPRLTDGPATGAVRSDAQRPVGITCSRADVARFVLDEVEQARYVRQAPFVAA
ncbi:NAD(P)H-binding protein [soil metagenome]